MKEGILVQDSENCLQACDKNIHRMDKVQDKSMLRIWVLRPAWGFKTISTLFSKSPLFICKAILHTVSHLVFFVTQEGRWCEYNFLILLRRTWGPSEVKRQAQGTTVLHLQCADYSPVSEAEWGRGD